MDRHYCDRCGKEIPDDLKRNQVRVLDFDSSNNFQKLDLCRSCTRGLWNYLNRTRINYNDIYREDY